ncbi:MAG: hypothetical protein K8R25_02460 [Methanosarcinales archaeon]|nr:hypothetical protein [Methanosarcinales archaeon]
MTYINLLTSSISLMSKIYKSLDFASPEGRDLEFSYPTQEIEVSWLLSIPTGFKRFGRGKILFNFPEINKISLRNLPLYTESDAIIKTDTGYILDVKKLDESEKFLLSVTYKAPRTLVEDLIAVQNSKSAMNIDNGIEEYWLSVALKKRAILGDVFKGFSIYGFENNIKISIQNPVSTAIPHSFIERLINITKFIKATDREDMHKVSHQRLRHQRSKTKHEDERKLILDLSNNFCSKKSFLKFINVDKPFIYTDAIQGDCNYSNIPFDVFPKSMSVVTTTNINFDNPTAEGKLYFKKNTFRDEIITFFEEHGY